MHFANLFFEACAADLDGDPIPEAWAPLFAARSNPHTNPIQFALAGMNAHICHDLPIAVVTTCQALSVAPEDDSPQHHDFVTTNKVLEDATEEIKSWFSTGLVATIDEAGGKVDDRFEMFAIGEARARRLAGLPDFVAPGRPRPARQPLPHQPGPHGLPDQSRNPPLTRAWSARATRSPAAPGSRTRLS